MRKNRLPSMVLLLATTSDIRKYLSVAVIENKRACFMMILEIIVEAPG